MSSEQEVRTRAGWIGVEISRSRVRTPGKAGFGLYRVRGTAKALGRGRHDYHGPWTAYAFTLEEIGRAITASIKCGTPVGPHELCLSDRSQGAHVVTARVPTRWTSAYAGRRDLGLGVVQGTPTGFERPEGLSGGGEGGSDGAVSSVRSSVARRAAERAAAATRARAVRQGYARAFKARRAVGLALRHAEKLARKSE